MKIQYFAYGSNMNWERFTKERSIKVLNKQIAVLHDYSRVFNKISATNPLLAVANIRQAPGETCYGILYEIDAEDLKIIDKYERAPEHYERIDVRVELVKDDTPTNEYVNAITYKGTVNHTFKDSIHKISPEYEEYILRAQKEFGVAITTRMLPQHQLFKNENILNFNDFLILKDSL